MKEDDAVLAIIAEYQRASAIHGPFNSAHEGYAVILEELDELWETIKNRKHVPPDDYMHGLTEEAIQVGAMALRILIDLCEE